jgi:MOSC domain-containing protein YiiM
MSAHVVAVSASRTHTFSKQPALFITLLPALGVQGDAHSGATVKHRSRVARDATQPNLRQVHLMHRELFDELAARGFAIAASQLGENVTTAGIDLLALPAATRLHLGASAVVELTGLRNPCSQLDKFRPGLMAAVLERAPGGKLIRKAGVMGIVVAGGEVRAGDAVEIVLPALPHRRLEPV